MGNDAEAAAQNMHVDLGKLQETGGGPEIRVFRYVQGVQEGDGSWETPWTDVCTALAIDMFRISGLSLDSTWDLVAADGGFRGKGGIRLALSYLRNALERQNHRWGTDWFDHSQVLRILAELDSGSTSGPLYDDIERHLQLAHAQLAEACDRDFEPDRIWTRKSDWHGAATLAAAAIAFKHTSDPTRADKCMEALKLYRLERGAYASLPDAEYTGDPDLELLLPWHTAYAVLALKRDGAPPGTNKLTNPIDWLLAKPPRRDDNSWGPPERPHRVDWTALVARAIYVSGSERSEVVKHDVISWLHEIQGTEDKIGTLEGSIHSLLFYATIGRLESESSVVKVPAPLLSEAQSVIDLVLEELKEAKGTVKDKESAVAELEDRIKDLEHDLDLSKERAKNSFHVTNKRAVLLGAIIAIIITVIASWGGDSKSDPKSPQPGLTTTTSTSTTTSTTR